MSSIIDTFSKFDSKGFDSEQHPWVFPVEISGEDRRPPLGWRAENCQNIYDNHPYDG
jgi:hypothetical protein